MADGWLKLHRKSLDSRIFQSEPLWRLWTWILLSVNHSESWADERTKVLPGQMLIGRNFVAGALKWKASTARDRLLKLQEWGMIKLQPDSQGTILSVCHWQTYQSRETEIRQRPVGVSGSTGADYPPDQEKSRQPSDNEKGEFNTTEKGISSDCNNHACSESDNEPTTARQPTDNGPTLKKKVNKAKKEKKKESTTPDKLDEVPAAVDHSGSEIIFPTQGSVKKWILPADKMREWQDAYEFDVLPEILKARQWCRDNRTKRKTIKGMTAFLCNWLNRTADSGSRGSQKQTEFKSAGERREQGNLEAMKGFLKYEQTDTNDTAAVRGHLD